jgi:hypothetical protein
MSNIAFSSRRRVRLHTMAAELGISVRKMREIHTLGLPFTQLEGLIWYEPEKVHAWLDKYSRVGSPGIKRVKGMQLDAGTAQPKRKRDLAAK